MYNQYRGNWGNYPWLPSGNIIAADMQNGLYVLKLSNASVGAQNPESQLGVQISPNPAQDVLNIRLQNQGPSNWSWSLRNAAGQTISAGNEQLSTETSVQLSGLPQGLYFVEIRDSEGKSAVRKVVVE